MRVIGTTLLVLAVLASPSGARAGTAQLPPVAGDALPGVPVQPPELPVTPPPLPEVKVPDLPRVVPTQVPTPPVELPEAPAAAATPEAPGSAGQPERPQSTPTAVVVSTPTARDSVNRAPAAGGSKARSHRVTSRPVRRRLRGLVAPSGRTSTGRIEPRRADSRPVTRRRAAG